MRILTVLTCILYLGINLLTHEVECRGGKGGSRGYNRYTKYNNRREGRSSGLSTVSLTVWEIVGVSFACVTVIGIVGFLVLYNFCDNEDDDEEKGSKAEQLVTSEQDDQVYTEDETYHR